MGTEEASTSAGKYVFLSSRVDDSSKGFLQHLYNGLRGKGIRTFGDDLERPEGEKISASLLRVIEESRISVIVFSNNYASSTWCLDELAHIVEAKRKSKEVIPIFYDVSPSDVRNQTGRFAAQFKKYEERYTDEPEKVLRWKAALTEVSNLSGWDSKDRCESDLIQDIVKDVWQRLNPGLPFPSSSQLAVNSMPSTPSSSSSQQKRECDVFISFRGEDTRSKFFGHLYRELVRYGISTFRDDKHVRKGKSISSEIAKAIKDSKICLVILSPNFASSTWCLDELSEMLPRRNIASMVQNINGIPKTCGEVCLDNREEVEKLMPTLGDAAMPNTRESCEPTKLRLLVNYNGKWANSGYTDGKTKGRLVSKDITYGELEDLAYRIVGLDPHEYKIVMKAKYESKQPTQPAEIIDDDDLKCFISENLSLDAKCRIPLCITLEPRRDDHDSERRCGSVAAGEHMKKIRTLILLTLLLSCFHLILSDPFHIFRTLESPPPPA